jgi:predicted ATPase
MRYTNNESGTYALNSSGTAMLERIHVENYKCLRDVTVHLGDFTILIGPNDSGKSSLLEVIQSFGKMVQQGYAGFFGGNHSPPNLVWRKDAGRHIVWEVEGTAAGHQFIYHLDLPVHHPLPREALEWDGKKLFWTEEVPPGQPQAPYNFGPGTLVRAIATGQGKQLQPLQVGALYLTQFVGQGQTPGLAEALTSSIEYQFELNKLLSPSIPQPGIVLDSSGSNLAAVLDILQNSPDRSSFETIEKSLHEAIPTLAGIRLPPAAQQPGAKALEFILSGNSRPSVTIPASLASGGALLLTAFLTLAYTQTASLLLFEEPENGLHPFRLQMVVDILRKMSRGEIGNCKRQIVITTHNPLLLNYANPEEVRVFVRHSREGTKVIPMREVPDIGRLLNEFALGELWYLLGEEKLFEEQPV